MSYQSPASGRLYREDGTVVNFGDILDEGLGGKGLEIIDDTNAHTPPAGQCYRCLEFRTDSVIDAYTVDASAPIIGTLEVNQEAQHILYGKFTSLTLTSGSCYAYLGVL